MLTKDTKARLADFFEGFELVEYLRISIEDVVEAFGDEIEGAIDDIEELMGVNNGRD